MSLLSPPRRPLLMPAWSRNDLWRRAAAVPSLDLNFAAAKALGPLVTFTRASTATFINSAGVLQTAATDVPRFDHDPVTRESLGLLVEEQRTNLLLNSDTLSTQSVTVTAVAHTLSFYGTGTVTLTGASTAGPATGTGAFPTRTTLTFTPAAGALTLTVTGSVTSAQLEAGALATSYIPTTAAAATRSADVASITGSNFSSWYRQDEGTVLADARFNTVAVNTGIVSFYDSASPTNNRHSVRIGNTVVTSGGTPVASFNQTPVLQAVAKYSYGYATDNFCQVLNSSTIATDTSGALPVGVNAMDIGKVEANSVFYANGTIRRLTYWPQRLTNSTLQAITQ